MGPKMGPKMGPLGPAFLSLCQYTESCRMRSMQVHHDGGGPLDLSRSCRPSFLTCFLYHSTAGEPVDSEQTACVGSEELALVGLNP